MTRRRESRWLQINVGLVRGKAGALASARALFDELEPIVRACRRDRRVSRFFFVRKPPDLRLRFLGPDPERDLAPEIGKRLALLKRRGHVTRHFRSVYEPEIRQFGGPEATDRVHAHFDCDTRGWLAFDGLEAAGKRTVPPETLTLAVMNDLFLATLGCPSEVWDVWENVVRAAGVAEGATPAIPAFGLDEILAGLDPAQARIARAYQRGNGLLARGLQRAWNRGRLECGLRAILPFVAMFHFNRHGFDGARYGPLVRAMARAWNPKRGLRGA